MFWSYLRVAAESRGAPPKQSCQEWSEGSEINRDSAWGRLPDGNVFYGSILWFSLLTLLLCDWRSARCRFLGVSWLGPRPRLVVCTPQLVAITLCTLQYSRNALHASIERVASFPPILRSSLNSSGSLRYGKSRDPPRVLPWTSPGTLDPARVPPTTIPRNVNGPNSLLPKILFAV